MSSDSGPALLDWVGRVVLALLALALLGFLLAAAVFFLDPAPYFRADLAEMISNETPQAKVDAYLRATSAGDETTATSLWEIPDGLFRGPIADDGRQLANRRAAVTRELSSLRPKWTGQPTNIRWWIGCEGEPVIDSLREPRCTGPTEINRSFFVRVFVSLGRPGDPQALPYVLDLATRDRGWWHLGGKATPRQWMLVDVYPASEQPLYAAHGRVA